MSLFGLIAAVGIATGCHYPMEPYTWDTDMFTAKPGYKYVIDKTDPHLEYKIFNKRAGQIRVEDDKIVLYVFDTGHINIEGYHNGNLVRVLYVTVERDLSLPSFHDSEEPFDVKTKK